MADDEPNNPQLEPTPDSEPEPSPEPTGDVDTKPAAQPVPVADWKDREMARLRERRRAAEAEAAELKTQLAKYQTTATPTATSPAPLDPVADFERRVAEEARRQAPAIAAQQEFNRRCNETVQKGQEQFGKEEFDSRLNRLKGVVDLSDADGAARFNNFVVAALETDDAARIIYELGDNPEEASRIFGLSPVRMAVELTKMAAPAGPNGEVSRAPRPIRPVTQTNSNRSPISPDDPDRADQLEKRAWFERREKQVNDRRQAGVRMQ